MARPPLWIRTSLALFVAIGISACGDDYTGIQAIPEVKITVTPTDLVLTTGQRSKLEATVRDEEGRVLWEHRVRFAHRRGDRAGSGQSRHRRLQRAERRLRESGSAAELSPPGIRRMGGGYRDRLPRTRMRRS